MYTVPLELPPFGRWSAMISPSSDNPPPRYSFPLFVASSLSASLNGLAIIRQSPGLRGIASSPVWIGQLKYEAAILDNQPLNWGSQSGTRNARIPDSGPPFFA